MPAPLDAALPGPGGAGDQAFPHALDAAPIAIGTTMLSLGDSIAAGIGAAHASEGCMALLAQRLRHCRPDLHLLNLAIPGETSASMLAPGGQLQRAEHAITEVLEQGGEVGPVTLSIGGNDAMEAKLLGDGAALLHLRENLMAVLTRLEVALRPSGRSLGATLCLQTVYNPLEALPRSGDHGLPTPDRIAPRRATRGGFNQVIRSVAEGFGLRLADVAVLFRGRASELTWITSGDIHPTGAGHEAIAAAYAAVCGWE